MSEDIIAHAIAVTSLLLFMLMSMASIEAVLEAPEYVQWAVTTVYLYSL